MFGSLETAQWHGLRLPVALLFDDASYNFLKVVTYEALAHNHYSLDKS